MWTARAEELHGGRALRVEVLRDDAPVPHREVPALWREDASFRAFFDGLLASAPMSAYLWETPPLTATDAERAFEFALVESPALATLPPDSVAFAQHFESDAAREGVTRFPNLAGDALLIAPCPRAPEAAYAHLAAFARGAPEEQRHALWRRVGSELERRLGDEPLWVSTNGLGVPWLHVRLDSAPKYYAHAPYRA